jgi:hypothetical protein
MRDFTSTSSPLARRRGARALGVVLTAATLALLLTFAPAPRAGAGPGQDPAPVDPAPIEPPPADPVPVPAEAVPADAALASGCTLVGSARECDLWVRSGDTTINGAAVPVWVFADTELGPLAYPGPVLVLESDETLVVHLHHRSSAVGSASLSIPAAQVAPDITGIANGFDVTYDFGTLEPGTYTYQAGPTPEGGLQIAMGMTGVIVVHPAGFDPALPTAFATGNPVPFDDELVLAVSEIDPRLNADPRGFDLSFYNPTLFLVNGQPYPTPAIDLQAGHNVYLRMANLGTQPRSIQLPGLRQARHALDSRRLPAPVDVAVQPIAPGQAADTMVHLPAIIDTVVPILDAGLHLHNGSGTATQGMLTLLHLPDGLAGVAAGPTTSTVATDAPTVTGADPLGVSATITSGAAGGVTDAELFLDDLERDPGGLLLGGTPMTLTPAGTSPTTATATIDTATLAALANGEHTVWVHGLDANGWGFVSATTFVIDRAGPVVHGVELTPAVGQGTTLHVQATADSTLTGTGTDIQAVQYAIDSPPALPGSGTPLATAPFADSPNPARASVSVDLDLSTLGLPDGIHTIYLEALDSAGTGHWSEVPTGTTFVVDTVGPVVSGVTVEVTPNNGTIAAEGPIGFLDAVRITGVAGDTTSGVVAAELSIGASPAPAGTGDAMLSTLAAWGHGTYGAYEDTAYAEIPLAAVRSMAEGDIPLWVRARDEAGNWGDAVSATLRLDKTPPVVGVSAGPGADQVTINATDPVSGGVNTDIVAIEYFVGADPGVGNATALTPGADFTVGTSVSTVVSGLSPGSVVGVRARDQAGSWSATAGVTLP